MRITGLFLFLLLFSCTKNDNTEPAAAELPEKFLIILGVAQDAGYPQAGCEAEHCQKYWRGEEHARYATSIGIVDNTTNSTWLFEATPDFKEQLHLLNKYADREPAAPSGIFLTHAHMGHYTGLIHLGREAMGTSQVPVYAMPRMASYLRENGPWSQLVKIENISLAELSDGVPVALTEQLSVTPLQVPHRDEFSETVGFIIQSPNKKVLFIPDIDKWNKWDTDIRAVIKQVDIALLDGTFYNNAELPNRDMSEIPHPFIEESIRLFADLPEEEKSKIIFIHFNHSNPLIFDGESKNEVEKSGYGVARRSDIIGL